MFLTLICGPTFGQDLTGIWRGTFFNPAELAMGGSKYRYEVQVDAKGRECKGVTYSYQTTRFYGKASLVGVWSPGTKNLVLQEDRMLELKITGGGDGCLMTCYLTYRTEDGKEYLEGTYTSHNMNSPNQSCGGGRVYLEKVPDTDFELEDFLLDGDKRTSPPKAGIKPGQEDFLVSKPPSNPVATKPGTSPAKPPVASGSRPATPPAKPPVAGPKNAPPPKPEPDVAKPVLKGLQPSSSSKPLFPGANAPELAATPPSGGRTVQPRQNRPATSPAQPPKENIAKAPQPANTPPASASSRPATTVTAPKTNPTPATKNATTGTRPANTQKPVTPKKDIPPAVAKVESKPAPVERPQLDIKEKEDPRPVKPKPVQVPPPPVLTERKNELFKTFTTDQKFIEISFFDNGEIDGDTISVYNNNRLIASRKGLSAKPISIRIELSDDDPVQEIVMVAENLGAIPPNTALMIVKAGKERYTLNLSSTEQKNAMVRFRYQP
ncbi:MAG TPA: hypothetical protein VK907_07665 [Phnomibacter sp.]|nr:hypothetical protein [Phnomibacter sp.]